MKTYDFGQSTARAPFSMHFTAHYADLEHEIKPVTSGYRLALVYSLCSNDKIALNLSKIALNLSKIALKLSKSEIANRLSDVLKQKKFSNLNKPFAIALDH